MFNRRQNIPYERPEFHTPVVSGKEKVGHPTQKSVELMRQLIEIHTEAGDIVLDPFMGSGSTGVAAVELGRSFIGVERDSSYFEIAQSRLVSTVENKLSDNSLTLF